METLLWGLVCLFGVAALADKVMTEEAVLVWRARTRELRDRVERMDVDAATAAANEWFVGLFDAIYDARFWSLRRFVRSALSSVLALAVITLLLGWEETVFGKIVASGSAGVGLFFIVVIVVFGSNLLADYFSLQETRWVLERCRRRRGGGRTIIGWIFVDLIATAFVFALGFNISILIVFVLTLGAEGGPIDWPTFGDQVRFLSRDTLLPFFLTTFFTSAIWISYVASVLGLKALRRNSRVMRAVLGTIAESRAPARATAGFLAGFLALGYGLVAAIAWTVG